MEELLAKLGEMLKGINVNDIMTLINKQKKKVMSWSSSARTNPSASPKVTRHVTTEEILCAMPYLGISSSMMPVFVAHMLKNR